MISKHSKKFSFRITFLKQILGTMVFLKLHLTLLFYTSSPCFHVEVDTLLFFTWIIVLFIGKLRKVVVNSDFKDMYYIPFLWNTETSNYCRSTFIYLTEFQSEILWKLKKKLIIEYMYINWYMKVDVIGKLISWWYLNLNSFDTE